MTVELLIIGFGIVNLLGVVFSAPGDIKHPVLMAAGASA